MNHIPVLLTETIELLNPEPGDFIIDGTLGAGGHAREIIKRIKPNGTFLGIDWDEAAVKNFQQDADIIQGNYADIPNIIQQKNLPKANGLLLDLGLSSDQFESSGRGYSFQKDEPLDMRYNTEDEDAPTAQEIISSYPESKLADLIWELGEERHARRIAKAIVETRRKEKITSTKELAEIITHAVPGRGRMHPATKTFMALRICVNRELENLKSILGKLPEIIAPEGRVVIISFHSLEDRIVKQHFRKLEQEGRAVRLTKKPIIPSREEITDNPRSRSAKLRAIEIR